MKRTEWSIVFYRDAHGSSPVLDFLRTLDQDAQQGLGWAIEQLRLRNVTAREPLARHLEGKLWELRRESKTNIYRLLYFFFIGQRIVFVHGFQKKTQKTPRASGGHYARPEAAGRLHGRPRRWVNGERTKKAQVHCRRRS